jgi:hypothetical protein
LQRKRHALLVGYSDLDARYVNLHAGYDTFDATNIGLDVARVHIPADDDIDMGPDPTIGTVRIMPIR